MDFHLYQDAEQHSPTRTQFSEIMDLFPTTFDVAHAPPFLTVRVQTLPPKPWPLTIAGLPLYLTTEEYDDVLDRGVMAINGPRMVVGADLGLRKHPRLEDFRVIFEEYERLGIKVERVQWFGWRFKVGFARGVVWEEWRGKMPRQINRLMVGYLCGEEEGFPGRRVKGMGDADEESCEDLPLFGRVADMHSVPVGSLVDVKTPSVGRTEGVLVGQEVRRVHVDQTGGDKRYVTSSFVYFGQGREMVKDEVQGLQERIQRRTIGL